MKERIVVSAVQFAAASANREENASRMAAIVNAEAVENGADLIVFPERANAAHLESRSAAGAELRAAAEAIPGPTTEALAERAREHGVHVIAGILEWSDRDDAIFDSAVIVGPQGHVVDTYRRLHLKSEEQKTLQAGNEIGVFRTDLATIGLSIGYDVSFPELARVQALEGAEIIISLWALDEIRDQEPVDSIIVQSRSRATENFVYFVASNIASETADAGHSSRSVIASCNGEALATATGHGEEVVRATLTDRAFRDQRMYLTIFRDRRPELYGLLVDAVSDH
jgi:omega-amidase